MTIENVQLVEEELEALEMAHKQEKFDTAIPTLDKDVREWLRRWGEPMTLFGENKGQRRTRLRYHYVKMGSKSPPPMYVPPAHLTASVTSRPTAKGVGGVVEATMDDVLAEAGQTEVFYTEGSPELLAARREFTQSSLTMALMRNRIQKLTRYGTNEEVEDRKTRQRITELMEHFSLSFSRMGSSRPICSIQYAPEARVGDSPEAIDMADIVASAGWSGSVTLWQGDQRHSMGDIISENPCRVHSVAWRPHCPVRSEPNAVLAVGRSTGNVSLHSIIAKERRNEKEDEAMEGDESPRTEEKSQYELDEEMLVSFDTADDRISQVAWHPLGRHVMASSYDGTWRLFDLAKEKELLVQEGHSMEVCSLAVHPDGSLVASGDAGGIIHIWDLRTGRSIMSLAEHLRRVLSLDFHPFNGCNLISAGEDRSALVWDIRRQLVQEKLLGHSKLISTARYDRTGEVAVTAGYDGIVKVWDSAQYSCVKNFVAHQTLIMSMDFRHQGKREWMGDSGLLPELATGGYDRSLKIWRNR